MGVAVAAAGRLGQREAALVGLEAVVVRGARVAAAQVRVGRRDGHRPALDEAGATDRGAQAAGSKEPVRAYRCITVVLPLYYRCITVVWQTHPQHQPHHPH